MLKKKKEALEKDVKAYVGDKTLKGAGKVATPILKGFGFLAGGVASAVLLFKGVKSFKKKK